MMSSLVSITPGCQFSPRRVPTGAARSLDLRSPVPRAARRYNAAHSARPGRARRSPMDKLAYGVGAVDFQQRVDYARMRAERLAKTQAALKQAALAAAILTRPENIRYTTALRGPIFAPALRYAIVFAEH